MHRTFTALLFVALSAPQQAQVSTVQLHAVENMKMSEQSPVIRQRALAGEPFTVAGPHGVMVGQQDGSFEAWVLPTKMLSHMSIEANVEGYTVPIALNTMAREIEVRPERTTITYSHIALVVRQIMFSPREGGPVVLFSVDSLKPVDLIFRFTPELRKMWPELSSGWPSAEWVERGGYYVLHSDFDDFAAAVALPGAKPGIIAPYQERPQVHPVEFRLHVDPKIDHGKLFPLLMTVATTKVAATAVALGATLQQENDMLPRICAQHEEAWRVQAAKQTRLITPDTKVNEAFAWAATSIEQLRAVAPNGEEALVAGYYASGDSARPGFGWFFGRDALYTLPAVDGFGDFALAKTELEFLLARQRADGKIMHEYSQTAGETAWDKLPYEYAAADATPLFLAAVLEYVRSSGDAGFLTTHRDAVMRAWAFETGHDADGDGIYDNSQGTGWVEDWKPSAPKQEIYMALLDEQASHAMGALADLLGDKTSANQAKERASRIHATMEREYYEPQQDAYAFSQNNGALDGTATLYPALAWWNDGSGLAHGTACLRRWASHDFATDWGVRDVAVGDPLYDGMSYHRGAVWPLFTGWAAMAQYGAGNALAGYQATMQNVDLTWAQDPGAVTELLSGDFFEPFGRSTSHQLWSSAMVITPLLRGMFGVRTDAFQHTVSVHPQLPADWPDARIEQLHVGDSNATLEFIRKGTDLVVTMTTTSGPKLTLQDAGRDGAVHIPQSAVDVSLPHALPTRGSRTSQIKVLSQARKAGSMDMDIEGTAGTEAALTLVKRTKSAVQAKGAEIRGTTLVLKFPEGQGYTTQHVVLSW